MILQGGNQSLQAVCAHGTEHGMGKKGQAASFMDQADSLHGGDPLPGDIAAAAVANVLAEGSVHISHIAPVCQKTGKMCPGQDAVRKGGPKLLIGKIKALLLKAQDHLLVPFLSGITEFLHPAKKCSVGFLYVVA